MSTFDFQSKACAPVLQAAPALQEEVFLQGLQNYLQAHSYSNTTSSYLWAEMDGVTGEDVSGWMRAWTFQAGIPRVQVLLDGPGKRDLMIYQVGICFCLFGAAFWLVFPRLSAL